MDLFKIRKGLKMPYVDNIDLPNTSGSINIEKFFLVDITTSMVYLWVNEISTSRVTEKGNGKIGFS